MSLREITMPFTTHRPILYTMLFAIFVWSLTACGGPHTSSGADLDSTEPQGEEVANETPEDTPTEETNGDSSETSPDDASQAEVDELADDATEEPGDASSGQSEDDATDEPIGEPTEPEEPTDDSPTPPQDLDTDPETELDDSDDPNPSDDGSPAPGEPQAEDVLCTGNILIAAPEDMQEYENCTEIDGTLTIASPQLLHFNFPYLTRIYGDLIIDGTGVLLTLEGLSALNEVNGDIRITNNLVLTELKGLEGM